MIKENTIKEINYIKGIAILLVFIGHASTPSFLQRPYTYEFMVQLIYSIHMPLFFLVSGFLSYKIINMNLNKEYLSFIKTKFYRLGVPFLIFSFITNFIIIAFKQVLNEPVSTSTLLDRIKTIFLYPEDGIMGALWFLYTLFFIAILAPFIVKLPLKLTITLSLLLNIFTPKYINFLSISRINFFLVYFLIGLYFRTYYQTNKNNIFKMISPFKKITLFIISAICIFSYSYIITNGIFISKYLLSTLNFLCGLCGMILILMLIEKIKNLKVCSTLSYLGQYSMDIYLFSWFFQITSMILITKILKISNYNIFFISNMIVGSFCLPFSIYILRRFNIFKRLLLGEFQNNVSLKSTPSITT